LRKSGRSVRFSLRAQNTTFWDNTVIVFTADHGDFGGSHGIHSKGGALYEEVMNVPLYVSYPSMRTRTAPVLLPYTCSGVDLLPFLYTLALGNHSWRSNNNDMVYYLSGRESIDDAVYQYNNNSNYTGVLQERRISGAPLYAPLSGNNNWQKYQPFVLHTTDVYSSAAIPQPGNANNLVYHPSHAVAFRTVDQTDPNASAAPFAGTGNNAYGGGKLGIYSFWDTCNQNVAPIMGINSNSTAPNEFEFYNYSPHPSVGALNANPQEVGNQYFDSSNNSGVMSSQAALYYNDFYNANNNQSGINIQNELYQLFTYNSSSGPPTKQVYAAIQVAFQNYIAYLRCAQGGMLTGNNNNGPVVSCSNSCPNCSNNNNNTCPPTYIP
jgi:hypothetical protein